MPPVLLDLTWKPSEDEPELPISTAQPYIGPAIYRNDGYSIRFTLLDENDLPYIPEGVMYAQIRTGRIKVSEVVGDPVAEFDVTMASNEVTIALTREQTAAIPDTVCFWDLQETFDDSEPVTWYTGKVKAWGDVTRVVV